MGLAPATFAVTPRQGRDVAVDSLRGLAIILVVAGHVIGGMRVAEDSAWFLSTELLVDVRVPLFTALSGFVFGLRPLPPLPSSGYRRFLWAKTRRLLVPLLTVGTLYALLQALVPGTNGDTAVTDVWRVYVYGLGPYWFLQAIFLVFLVVGLADALGWLSRPRNALMAIAVTTPMSMFLRVPEEWDLFSVNGLFSLLPFFLLGHLFSAHFREIGSPRWLLAIAAVGLFALRCAEVFDWVRLPPALDAALSVLLGIAAISALLAFRASLAWKPLAVLGYFSFGIYLLHPFGATPVRMVLTQAGMALEPVVFLAALITALALPVVFEVTLGRVGWISWAFLGQRPYTPPTR